MNTKNITEVKVNTRQKVVISTEVIEAQRAPSKHKKYYPIAQHSPYCTEETMELPEILKDLSTSATWLFWTLVQNRNYTNNTVHFDSSQLSSADLKRLRRGYKELNQKDLVIRIKQNHYLINPKAVLVTDHKTVLLAWEHLKN